MDPKILKSSIKAYCLELLETSTLGGEGGYLTKNASRKPKKQDKNSPTGFESSPKPNMYTKTMKFKIVDPKQRLNSKDLWKGQHLEEIKVNQPVIKAKLNSGDENNILVYKSGLKYSDYKDEIDKSLEYQGYDNSWDRNKTTWSLISFPEGDKIIKYWWNDDEIEFPTSINENNTPSQSDFPIRISSYEMGQMVGSWLNKYGYEVNINKPPFNVGKGKFIPFTLNSNETKKIVIDEIKVNNPNLLKLVPGKYYDFLRFRGNQAVKEFTKHPRFHSLEEINGKKVLWELGYKYKGVEIFEDHEYHQFIDPYDGEDFIGWGKEHIEDLLKKNLIRTGSKQEGAMNESRYTQFKRSTSKPKPREILHRAIKEIQMKLDDVNRLIEFTTRIKGELQENDQEIEYLKRTKDSLYKIQDKLKEAFRNISSINEIKVNKPPRIIDFLNTSYQTWMDIKNGDWIITPNGDKEEVEKVYFPKVRTKSGEYNLVRLNNQNNKNKI